MIEKLREEDVRRLLANPLAETRAEIADKIAGQHPRLSEKERKLAEDIFRLMVRDAEVLVRQALSRQLQANPLVPRDVALSLARDVEDVALPILQFSEVLTDEDLIEIVQHQSLAKAAAVARRDHLSSAVCAALVEKDDEDVVATLVSNPGAEISDVTLGKVVDRFGGNDLVARPLVERANLPVTVTERLMAQVSDHLQRALVLREDLPQEQIAAMLLHAREMAVLGLLDKPQDVERMVDHLYRNGRLTPSIMLRSVCIGDLSFFEAAMARFCRIPLDNARTLIHDAGRRGFDALFAKAGLPASYFTAMRAAIDVSYEIQYDGLPRDRERFSRRMIERILTQYGDLGVQFDVADLNYLLLKLDQIPPSVLNDV